MSEDIKYIIRTSAESLFNVYRALLEYSKEKLDKKIYETLQKYDPESIIVTVRNNVYVLRAIFPKESPIERIVFKVEGEKIKVTYLTREQLRSLIELLEELSY